MNRCTSWATGRGPENEMAQAIALNTTPSERQRNGVGGERPVMGDDQGKHSKQAQGPNADFSRGLLRCREFLVIRGPPSLPGKGEGDALGGGGPPL